MVLFKNEVSLLLRAGGIMVGVLEKEIGENSLSFGWVSLHSPLNK